MATSFAPLAIDIVDLVVGDSAEFAITVQDSNGDDADLTGYTATASVTTSDGDQVALDEGISGAVVTVTITPAMSVQFGRLNDVQVEITDGTDVYTIGHGTIATIENVV